MHTEENPNMHSIRRLLSAPAFPLSAVLFIALACSSFAVCEEIHDAAAKGDLARVQALVKEDPKWVLDENKSGSTALDVAVLAGHKDIVEFLLANNAKVDAKDGSGRTPLHSAAEKGYKEIAELLLANHANVNAKDRYGSAPLHYAAFYKQKAVAEVLIANHAQVNARANNGATPLHLAALNGDKEVAELLLVNKADANAKGEKGWTPLHCARKKHNIQVADLICKYGGEEDWAGDETGVTRRGAWRSGQ
jgi:ankyrin repeat protein